MNLRDAKEGAEYRVDRIDTGDGELNSFLFSLGCYSGESVTVIKHRRSGSIISLKDVKYSIDRFLGEAIIIEEK